MQGVYYRAWTNETARSLNLDGTVRNMSDGSVEAVFSGPAQVVEDMVRRCKDGPKNAQVSKVTIIVRRRHGRAGLQGDRHRLAAPLTNRRSQ